MNPKGSNFFQRERVYEHRITFHHNYLIRLWIEADPDYGGIKSFEEAKETARKAYQEVYGKNTDYPHQRAAIDQFLTLMPSINSIEMTDERSNGLAVHRDWP